MAAPVAPPWLRTGRIPALDGLRAVAVLLVIFAHAEATRRVPSQALERTLGKAAAEIGVDIFFVLSGFLITTMLCREREARERISLRSFYRRRVLRLFPAFAVYLLFVAGLASAGSAGVAPIDWVSSLTYTMNFREHPAWELGHLWSLSLEEHFYLLWPPIFARVAPRTARRLLVGVLVAEPLLRALILVFDPPLAPVTELWTPTRLDGIAAGCLLALVVRKDEGARILDAAARRWPVAVAGLALAMAGGVASGKVAVCVAPSAIAVALTVLVWAAVRFAPAILEGRAAVAIGVGSYSLYLWQQAFLNPRHDAWWSTLPWGLVLAAVFAAISFRAIETPFLRLKKG